MKAFLTKKESGWLNFPGELNIRQSIHVFVSIIFLDMSIICYLLMDG